MEATIKSEWSNEIPFKLEQVKKVLSAYCVKPYSKTIGLVQSNFNNVERTNYFDSFGLYQIFGLSYTITINVKSGTFDGSTVMNVIVAPGEKFGNYKEESYYRPIRDKVIDNICYYLTNIDVIENYYNSSINNEPETTSTLPVQNQPDTISVQNHPEDVHLTADEVVPGIVQLICLIAMIGCTIYAWML